MNTQNAEFLKKSLLNLGFGDKLNAELDKEMAAKTPEFKLGLQHEFNQKTVDYTLHFKAGDNQDMYFFNKYDATINHKDDPAKNIDQTFFINKGSGITAKEAFNLMEGRAVHKQLYNLEGQKYQAWLTLDDKNLTDNGNKKIKHYLLQTPEAGGDQLKQKILFFYQRLMQFTGPLMAKGVEDTLMYTFNRFIGHNEVGDASHAKYKERQKKAVMRRLQLGGSDESLAPVPPTAGGAEDVRRKK